MKKIMKTTVPIVLTLFMIVGGVVGSYERAHATGLEIGLLEILEGLIAAFGGAYVTSELISGGTDGSSALQDWKNDWDTSYEQARLKLIEGGAGGTDPEDPKDPDHIPHFDEIISAAATTGLIDLGKESWQCLKDWYLGIIDDSYSIGGEIADLVYPDGLDIPEEVMNNEFRYVLYIPLTGNYASITEYHLTDSCYGYWLENDKKGNRQLYIKFSNGYTDIRYVKGVKSVTEYPSSSSAVFNSTNCDFTCIHANFKIYPSKADYEATLTKPDPYTRETIWVHPDIEDSYKNHSDLEYYPPANPYNVPSIQQLQDLQTQGQEDPALKPEIMQEYLKSLGLNPDAIHDPDVVPTPDPDPKPDPNPDPDNPDPDNPGGDTPSENESFTADLKELFPFCIPFDIIRAIKVLSKEGEAPVYTIPFKVDYGELHINETWVIDMSKFDSVVQILRILEVLGFVVGLAMITRNLIRG